MRKFEACLAPISINLISSNDVISGYRDDVISGYRDDVISGYRDDVIRGYCGRTSHLFLLFAELTSLEAIG